MDLFFVLLTQLVNHTPFVLGFKVESDPLLMPRELLQGKTRCVRLSRIIRRNRLSGKGWRIRVLIGKEFSGIELDPDDLLKFVRVVFRIEEKEEGRLKWNVLCVDGVLENDGSDYLFRHRYIGWRRDSYWNRRPLQFIDRSDSSVAAKLRSKGGDCRYLGPFANDTSMHPRDSSTYASPPKKGKSAKNNTSIYHKHKKPEEEISKDHLVPTSPRVASDRPNGTAIPPKPRLRAAELAKNNTPISHKHKKIEEEILLPASPRVASDRPSGTATPQKPRSRDAGAAKNNTPIYHLPPASPQVASDRPNGTATPQGSRSWDDEPSSVYVVEKSLVHMVLIVFSFMVFICVKFL